MKYLLSAEGWQDSKKCNLELKSIKEYLGQFHKFRVSEVYRKFGYIVNMRFYRFVRTLRANKISLYRIVKIDFLVISGYFEITYRKRHYGHFGHYYYKY